MSGVGMRAGNTFADPVPAVILREPRLRRFPTICDPSEPSDCTVAGHWRIATNGIDRPHSLASWETREGQRLK